MRTIVQEEGVDVVVDAGDLVNFGTVEEAEATGLFSGIESVGVPYLFVRGNHDANSATDTALLDRLARLPNVTLLEDARRRLHRGHRARRAHRRLQRPPLVRRLGHRFAGQAGAGARGVHGGVRRSAGGRPGRRARAVVRGGPGGWRARQRPHALGRPRGQPGAGRHLHRRRAVHPLPRGRGRRGAGGAAVGLRRAHLRHRLPARHPDPLPVPRRHRGPAGLRRRVARQRSPGRRSRARPHAHLFGRRAVHDDHGAGGGGAGSGGSTPTPTAG